MPEREQKTICSGTTTARSGHPSAELRAEYPTEISMKMTVPTGSTVETPAPKRRDLLVAALSAGALAAAPHVARATEQRFDMAASSSELFTKLMTDFAEEILVLSPRLATGRGLDSGARAGLKYRLDDRSSSGEALWANQVDSMAKRLAAIDRGTLKADEQIRYDTLLYSANAGIEGNRFAYGGGAASGFFSGTSPYVVSQQDGAITDLPEFLASTHRIDNAADAEAYLSRLAAIARVLDQESDLVGAHAAAGIIPPDFIARTALGQLKSFRETTASMQKLVTSIAERTRKRGIDGDWAERATRLVTNSVYPALDRQIATFAKATARADGIAGVHRLPDGEAYYRWALKLGTSTSTSPAEVHAIGSEQNKELQSRMDAIMRGQGMTQGTIGERLNALSGRPEMLFPDNDLGREQMIAYCNNRVDAIRKLMPRLSHLALKAPLEIRRVPKDIEAGAPLGYMSFASIDGLRPAIYYINLKSTSLWPRPALATLTAHEGVPGHAWQSAYLAEHRTEIPLIASLCFINAFIEGWALYAEQLIDEAGLYAADPFSRIGYLQAQQFRACRMVVDTGIHSMRWSRQRAIQFLAENTGRDLNAVASEIDRYVAWPGQACGYKMGHNEMISQRARAKQALGEKFDLAGFNDAIVGSTGVPLTILPTVVDRFIAASRG